MPDAGHIMYRSQSSPRAVSLFFIVGAIVVWFVLCGYDILVLGSPFTLGYVLFSAFMILLAAVLLFYAIRGGVWLLEITDSTVYWCDPDAGERTIRDDEVEHFEVLVDRGGSENDGSPSIRIRITLKSGEAFFVPGNCAGDEAVVLRLLRKKWPERAVPAS